jgi:predicted RNase H-like nuclease (RuvC/YqgF family)
MEDQMTFDPSFYEKLKNIFNRKRNNEKLSKEVRSDREKRKKIRRKLANKARNVNQKKNKLNKFQR